MAGRAAIAADVPAILQCIRDLAEYEREPDAVEATEDSLHDVLFRQNAAAFCHVVEHENEIVGIALWFLNFSTWTGRHGIYLEDLYVKPEFRGHGYGKQLMKALACICEERGYTRFEWSVLNWNEPTIAVYEKLGAKPMSDWTTYRLDGQSLKELAPE